MGTDGRIVGVREVGDATEAPVAGVGGGVERAGGAVCGYGVGFGHGVGGDSEDLRGAGVSASMGVEGG